MTGRQERASASDVHVWDWPLRIFHWLLVVSTAGAWATHYAGIEWFAWHRRCGYTTLVLVGFRVAWGFFGSRHARFSDFVRGPGSVMAYLRSAGRLPMAGHNPAGALAVLAFIAALLFQASTGLFANDEIANTGPFFGWVTQQTSNRLTHWHALNSKILLGLIAFHVLAVGWYDLVRRAGLLRAMFTGRKQLPAEVEPIEGSHPLRALAIVLALAAALALAIRAAPEATVALF